MFWYFLFMALFGFICGLRFYKTLLTSGFTKEEKMYLNAFYRALKEGKYKLDKSDKDK